MLLWLGEGQSFIVRPLFGSDSDVLELRATRELEPFFNHDTFRDCSQEIVVIFYKILPRVRTACKVVLVAMCLG